MFYRYDNSPVLQGSQLHQQLHRLHLVNKTSLFFLLIRDEVDGVGDGGLGVGGWRLLARLERLFIANYLLCELNYNLTLITISTLPNLYLTVLKYHTSKFQSLERCEWNFIILLTSPMIYIFRQKYSWTQTGQFNGAWILRLVLLCSVQCWSCHAWLSLHQPTRSSSKVCWL